MLFNGTRKKLLGFIGFLLLIITAYAPNAYANVDSLLLATFKMNLQDADEVEMNFNTALYLRLEEQGFKVTISNTDISNTTDARTLASAQAKYATLFGTITQIGKSFLVDAQYVTASGQSTPIIFEIASTFPADGIAARITLATLQASNLPAYKADTLSEIRIEGNKAIDTAYITARIQATEGSPLPNEEELNQELARVWRTGYFQDVVVSTIKESGNNILLIKVQERPIITRILVQGSDIIDIDDIEDEMVSSTGSVLNESVLKNDIAKVEELYRKKAYYNVEVGYTIENANENTAELVLHVEAGNKLFVRNIDFVGFNEIDTDPIRDQIPIREKGFFSVFTGSGVLKEEELEISTEYIGSYAVNEGYVQSRMAAPEVIYETDGIRVIFKIDTGPRYKVGNINFDGMLIADPDVFYEVIGIDEWKEENGYFSLITMQDDVKALTEYYNDQGYAFARVNMEDNLNEVSETMDITYVITPSTKTSINRVNVKGNYKTRDNVIIRELRLADGDEYSSAKVTRTRERLQRTGYFGIVDVQVEPTEDPALADLTITVEEGSTGSISGGVGYSSTDGAGISAAISQNNLFGRGYSLGVDGYLAEHEMNMNTHFYNPRVYNTNLGAGISLYGITEEWTEFDRDTLGGQLNLGYPIGEYTSARVGYRLDNYTVYNVATNAATSIKTYEGDNLASVLSFGFVRDTTDANFFPTKGTKATATFYYGGDFLGGTDNFIKTIYELGGYFTLFDDHTFHLRSTYAGVFKNTNDVIPAFERLYIGGMTSIRGYKTDDLSPRDPRTYEEIGADRAFYGSLEYIWVFERNLGLALVPFVDYASVADSDYTKLFEKQFFSAGLEMRWSSPMGDLRFAYGYPLSRDYYGNKLSSGRFEFTMGNVF